MGLSLQYVTTTSVCLVGLSLQYVKQTTSMSGGFVTPVCETNIISVSGVCHYRMWNNQHQCVTLVGLSLQYLKQTQSVCLSSGLVTTVCEANNISVSGGFVTILCETNDIRMFGGFVTTLCETKLRRSPWASFDRIKFSTVIQTGREPETETKTRNIVKYICHN